MPLGPLWELLLVVGYCSHCLGNLTGKYNDVMQPAKRESALRAQGGAGGGGGPLGAPGGPRGAQRPARTLPVACQNPASGPGTKSWSPGTKVGPRAPEAAGRRPTYDVVSEL